MPITKGPAKGKQNGLQVTPEGARRFVVGLGWNPYAAVGVKIEHAKGPDDNLISKIAHALFAPFEFFRVGTLSVANAAAKGAAQAKYTKTEDAAGRDAKSSAYDLDLDCYIFDQNMQFKCLVGTEDDKLIDPSKKVYHTGDDMGGSSGPDDEQLFVETNGLPPDYHHFYFVVKCDSKYTFSQYDNATIRLADSKTNESQLECRLSPVKNHTGDTTGQGMYNYLFCRVSRAGDGWTFTAVDEYLPENFEWENWLPRYPEAA